MKLTWAALRAPWVHMQGVVGEGDAVFIVEATQRSRWAHAAATQRARGFGAARGCGCAGCVGSPPRWHRIAFVDRALPATPDPRARSPQLAACKAAARHLCLGNPRFLPFTG